jgi:glycosyltransferase involved in cell wall biosynthesis
MKEVRITLVTPFFPNSEQPYRGSATYQLVRRLGELASVTVVCPLPRYPDWFRPTGFDHMRPNLSYKLPDVDVKYIEYPAIPLISRGVNGMMCAHCMLEAVRSLRPDLILNYWLYPHGFAAVQVASTLGVPSIVGSIGTDLNGKTDVVTRFWTRRTLKRAASVVTKSYHLRDTAIALGADPAKVHTVWNGCDTSIFQVADRLEACADLNLDPARQLIVYVGRLEYTKGLTELLEAFAFLIRRKSSVELAFIGNGPAQDMMEEHANKLGVAGHVRFVPPQTPTGVSRWLAAARLLTLPSYAEGFPNVIIEAIACGRPIVATNVGGIPEMVNDACGILVPPRDVRALEHGLEAALERSWDPATIASHFRRSWEDMARELFEICLAVLSNKAVSTKARSVIAQHS